MPNKDWHSLLDADRDIRAACSPPGPGHEGVLLKIEYVGGFEIFNTRKYHNYETWSSGYRVTGDGVTAEMEDLDEALALWTRRRDEAEALR